MTFVYAKNVHADRADVGRPLKYQECKVIMYLGGVETQRAPPHTDDVQSMTHQMLQDIKRRWRLPFLRI